MVTIRQVAKTYISAVKAAERNQKRRAKESARLFKEQQRQNEISNAADAIRRYDEYIEALMSVHKNCADKINWSQIERDEEPPKPVLHKIFENEAILKLKTFTPNFFHKIFGSKNKIKSLERAIEQGKVQDRKDFDANKELHDDWQKIQNIAKGIRAKIPQSYTDAINYFEPFTDISDFGSRLKFFFNQDYVEIELHVNNSEVIPDYILSLTKTGKLSKKDMPKGKFNELYQDYVCGGLLRVARDTFAFIPVKALVIHAMTNMVNTATGHLENVPIVSAVLPPETIDKLNFQTLDPSDSMKNFLHNMKFSKINGFSQVEKLDVKLKLP